MKTATILFYVSPSIETRIKNAKTIDLMEGGKEQARNVPSSEIICCDEDGKEGHADGSSRDVPIQTDSEGAKKMVDICVDGKKGKTDDSSDKNDKKDDDEEEGESGEVDSSSGEESSSPAVVCPCPRPRRLRRNPNVLTSTDSSGSSSDSSDSSSLEIPQTPLEMAAHE